MNPCHKRLTTKINLITKPLFLHSISSCTCSINVTYLVKFTATVGLNGKVFREPYERIPTRTPSFTTGLPPNPLIFIHVNQRLFYQNLFIKQE